MFNLRPPVRMEKLGSYWTDFYELYVLVLSRKSVWEIKVPLKIDTNDRLFT